MSTAKVYFTDMHTEAFGDSLLTKLQRLIRAAGIEQIDMENKFVAIKLHFGERGNLAFLRPNYVRVLAEQVTAQKGLPFATDCSTLYTGYRKNGIDHLYTAQLNGFNTDTCGCPIIMGDGLKGADDVELPVPHGELVQTAKIGRTVADADVLISLTHFKCHEMTSFGGAIKNLGMGCASRRGKMELHCTAKPTVDRDKCRGCKSCLKVCAHTAIAVTAKKAAIDHDRCVGCGRCIATCPFDAITVDYNNGPLEVSQKTVEYAAALCADRPTFHVAIMTDISPYCDCHPENDTPIIPSVGMLASRDPVALDKACVDLANRQHAVPGSLLDKNSGGKQPADVFICVNPTTSPAATFDHAKKIGFGTTDYELVTVR